MKVFLIYPPFGYPFHPYISIPALAAYLKSRHIRVSCVDANNEFFHSLVTPENVRKGQEYSENRLAELNGKARLLFSEAIEYSRLVRVFQDVGELGEPMRQLFTENSQMPWNIRAAALVQSLRLASSPRFPETADFLGPLLKYLSRYSEFSTHDILEAVEQNTELSAFFEKFLPPLLKKEAPDLVGISLCFSDQFLGAFQCAKIVKRIAPHVHVTMGGPFISTHFRNVNELRIFDLADSFVTDEGEIPLERLIDELSRPRPDFSRVPSLIYREGAEIRRTGCAPFPDINSLPSPDYQVFPLDRYFLPPEAMWLLFRSSRGCKWGRCAFCQTGLPAISRYQQKSSTDHIYDQLESLVKETNIRQVLFTDDSPSPEVLEGLCRRMLDRGLKIEWTTHLRFDPTLSLERCSLFRQAGCSSLTLGLEAYNDRLLSLMNKGITTKLVDRILSNLAWAGLSASVYIIFGFPTETEQEALSAQRQLEEFRQQGKIDRFHCNAFFALPHSGIMENPQKYGIRRLIFSAGQDLDPPAFEFEGEGMPREKVLELWMPSHRTANGLLPRNDKSLNGLKELHLNGKILSLNHNTDQIRSSVYRSWKPFLAFGKWLEEGDRVFGRF